MLKNERGNETGIWTYLVCSQLHYPHFPSSRALTHAFKPLFGRHRSFFQALLPTKERCLQKWRSANLDPDSCNSFGLNPECWRLLTARKQDALESPLLRIFTNLNIMTPVRRNFEQSEYHERIEYIYLTGCLLKYHWFSVSERYFKSITFYKIWVPRIFFCKCNLCQHNVTKSCKLPSCSFNLWELGVSVLQKSFKMFRGRFAEQKLPLEGPFFYR